MERTESLFVKIVAECRARSERFTFAAVTTPNTRPATAHSEHALNHSPRSRYDTSLRGRAATWAHERLPGKGSDVGKDTSPSAAVINQLSSTCTQMASLSSDLLISTENIRDTSLVSGKPGRSPHSSEPHSSCLLKRRNTLGCPSLRPAGQAW